MTLEDAYVISKKKVVSEEEAVEVVSYYIKLLKGRQVRIKSPKKNVTDIFERINQTRQYQKLVEAFTIASTFIVTYKDAPQNIKVKVHA